MCCQGGVGGRILRTIPIAKHGEAADAFWRRRQYCPASVWGVGGTRDSSQGRENGSWRLRRMKERDLQLEVVRKDHQEAEGVRARGKSRHRFFPLTAH